MRLRHAGAAVATATSAMFLILQALAADDPPSLKFAQLFNKLCVENFPDVGKIREFAAAEGLKEATDKLLVRAIGPASPNLSWQGWHFEKDRIRYIIGFSEGVSEGVPTQTCNLTRLRNGGKEIVDQLSILLNAKKEIEWVESGTLTAVFSLKKNEQSLLFTLTDYEPSKLELLTVTLMNDRRTN